MTFKYSKCIMMWLFSGAICPTVLAQSDSLSWKDFSFVKHSEAWFQSENAAGLNKLSVNRISMAEAYYEKHKGDFVNYYQSDNCYNWGAETESYYRFSPHIVLYGKVSYDSFTGKNMGGSVFIHPEDAPFDIVEYSDDTRGEKSLETYHLVGALGIDLSNKWALGAKVDFTAANYSKDKDLRHTNKLMDLNATVGFLFRPLPQLEVGANYYYRRSTEGVDFDTYGTTDQVYTSLISYGAFYGVTEEFGSYNSYTKDGEEKPLFNEYQGGTLQVNWQITPRLSWFSEVGYKSRDGYYGKKSPYTVIYSEHESDIWEYKGSFSLRERNNLHMLNINFRHEDLENNENIYQKETSGGGNSDIVYYGESKVGERTTWNLAGEYVGYWGISDYNPTWIVKAGGNCNVRDITATVYPNYRTQKLTVCDFHLSGERNITREINQYSILLGAAYRFGSGDIYNDGIYTTSAESSPKTMETYMCQEYDYLTVDQIKGEAGFKYSRILKEQNVRCHVSLHYELWKAFSADYLGNGLRHEIRLAVGCTF